MRRNAFLFALLAVFLLTTTVALAEYGTWEDIYDGAPGMPPGLSNTSFMAIAVGSENNLYTVGMAQTGALDVEYGWASKDGGYTFSPVVDFHGGSDPCDMLMLFQMMFEVHAIGPDTAIFAGMGPQPECLEQYEDPLCMFVCMFTMTPVMLYTDDGGATMQRATQPLNIMKIPTCMDFAEDEPLVGFVGGAEALLLKTEDGGVSWADSPRPSDAFSPNDVNFVTTQVGYTVSGDMEPETDDDSWVEDKSEPEPGSPEAAQRAYARGIHRWRYLHDAVYRLNFQAEHPDAKRGMNGMMYKTTDGGQTWQLLLSEPYESFLFLHMVNEQVGWMVSEPRPTEWPPFKLYKTTDGGENWTDYTSRVPYEQLDAQGLAYAISAISFSPSGQTGFLGGGAQKLQYKSLLFYTVDGGETWEWDQSLLPWGHPIISFGWLDNHLAWQAGFDLSIYRYEQTNTAPVADAGNDQTVAQNTVVTLDGSGSYDPDGDTITYAWEQASGPTAALTGADTAQPTFTVTELGDYVFQLTVTDTYPESSFDKVTITVTEAADDDAVDDDVADDDSADDDNDNNVVADDDDDDSGCGC